MSEQTFAVDGYVVLVSQHEPVWSVHESLEAAEMAAERHRRKKWVVDVWIHPIGAGRQVSMTMNDGKSEPALRLATTVLSAVHSHREMADDERENDIRLWDAVDRALHDYLREQNNE